MKGYIYSFVIFGILLSGCNIDYNKKAKRESSIQRLMALEKEIEILQSEQNSSDAQKRRSIQSYQDFYDDGQIDREMYTHHRDSISRDSEEDKQRKSKLAQLEEERKNLDYSLRYNS